MDPIQMSETRPFARKLASTVADPSLQKKSPSCCPLGVDKDIETGIAFRQEAGREACSSDKEETSVAFDGFLIVREPFRGGVQTGVTMVRRVLPSGAVPGLLLLRGGGDKGVNGSSSGRGSLCLASTSRDAVSVSVLLPAEFCFTD